MRGVATDQKGGARKRTIVGSAVWNFVLLM